jgi:DedD protein
MADRGMARSEQLIKKRAMRRLAIALTLIAVAIAGLALLDRYNASLRKPEIPPAPLEPRALPGELPMQAPVPAPAPSTPTQPQPPSQQAEQRPPSPPPPTVSNEALPPNEPARAVPKAATEVPEGTETPAKRGPAAAPREKQAQGKVEGAKGTAAPVPPKAGEPQAPKPAEPQTAKSAEPQVPKSVEPPAQKAVEPQAPKGFAVQVGVFSTAERARALQAKLSAQGIPSSIQTRVVVGPFNDRAEADAVIKHLKELGLEGVAVAPH